MTRSCVARRDECRLTASQHGSLAVPQVARRGGGIPTILKTLEYRWRRALLAAGHRPFSGRATSRPDDLLRLPPAPRILIIRLERIGDVLVGIPVIRALRRRYPDARIDLLVSRANRAVGEAVAPFVTKVWCYEKTVGSAVGLLRALRRTRYDVVVDLIDHPSTTAQLVIRWCRPRAAVGLLHGESGLYTHAAPTLDPSTIHPVERFAQLLLPFGIDPAVENLELEYRLGVHEVARAESLLGSTPRPLRFGVNVSARQPERSWGSANFVAAIRHMAARDSRFAISVCGTPRDALEVARVAEAAGVQAVPPCATLDEFAAVIHEFDLLLTPDTAVVHLAAAWKLPTVALYQAEEGVALWLPYKSPHRAITNPGGIPMITVDEVVAALDDLVAERFGEPPPRVGGHEARESASTRERTATSG